MVSKADPKPVTQSPLEAVGITALMVAQLRTFTDIPHAAEMAKITQASFGLNEVARYAKVPVDDLHFMAFLLEQRYKAIDVLLEQGHAENIHEMAAGLSTRGLNWRKGRFLESDFEAMMLNKIKAIKQMGLWPTQSTHQLMEIDATNRDQVLSVQNWFRDSPRTTITEGLLPYLDIAGKTAIATNIFHFLRAHPGSFWVTSDVSSKERFSDLEKLNPKMLKVLSAINKLTGVDLQANAFETTDQAEKLFRQIGFSRVRRFKQDKLVPQLSARKRLSLSDDVARLLKKGEVWMMEV